MDNRWFAVPAPRHTDPQIFFDAGCEVIPSLVPYIVDSEFKRREWFIRINKQTLRIEGRASVDWREGMDVLPPCYSPGSQHPCDYMSLEDFIETYIGSNFKTEFSLEEVLAG